MNYEYGVEYQTNGQKPELPDDVLVEFKNKDGVWNVSGSDALCSWAWCRSSAFRIVDERYNWHDRGELPPVGEECEVYIEQRNCWAKVKVLAVDGDYIVWRNGSDNKSYIGTNKDNVRPIRTEREKAIEAASKIAEEHNKSGAKEFYGALYDAGLLRLPEEK